MKKLIPLITAFLLAGLLALQADGRSAEELFYEANALSAGEAFEEAIPLYLAALEQRSSANLHYNLGYAYKQTGDPGRARIHWERTLVLEPRHSLAKAQLQILVRELELPEATGGAWGRAVRQLSFNQWIWMAAGGFWLSCFSLLAWRGQRSRAFLFPAGIGAICLTIAAGALATLGSARHDAVVLAEEAPLRIAPTSGSPSGSPVRSARVVRITAAHGEFVRVRLEDGQEGFLRLDQVERIHPGREAGG